MTIEEFGQTVKAKHPQYNDLPDADLGQKMLAKYPQYKDMVDGNATADAPKINMAPKKEPSVYNSNPYLKTILGGINEVTPKIAKANYDVFSGFGKEALKRVDQGVGLGNDLLNSFIGKFIGVNKPQVHIPEKYTTSANDTQKVGAGIENILEMLAPVGLEAKVASKIPQISSKASFTRKVAQNVLRTGAKSVASGAEFGGKTLLQTGDTKKATEAGLISAIVPPVAGIIKGTGKSIAEAVIPLSAKEAKYVQAYRAKVPIWERVLVGSNNAPITAGKTAFNKGIMGTESMIGVGAKRETNDLWNNFISPQLKKSTVKVDMPTFFKEARQQIIKENPEKSMQKSLLEALDSFKDDYAGVGKVAIKDIQEFKKGWAKTIPEKVYMGKSIAGAANNVKNTLADIARNKIYNALGPEARQAYFDYGNLQGLQELGQKAMTGGKLKGGFGGFWSSIKDMALVPVGTVGGKVLYKTGQGIEFIGKQGAKSITDLFDN